MTAESKGKWAERRGIASAAPLRDVLESIDGAIVELSGLRSDYAETIQDAFTPLRSSAQIFREIFYGVPLPVHSPKELIERAGGPYRLIAVSYKEMGFAVFALGDVVAAIPKFETVFPIKDFNRLAEQLELIREKDTDTGATWFVGRIKSHYFNRILKQELDVAKHPVDYSALTRPRANLIACGHCGARHSPATAVLDAFKGLQVQGSADRWLGGPAEEQ